MKDLMKLNTIKGFAFALACLLIGQVELIAQDKVVNMVPDTEDDFYKLISLPVPEDVILEVGEWQPCQMVAWLFVPVGAKFG